MKKPIIINNPGYNRIEKIVVKRAFELLDKVPKSNKSRHFSFLTVGNSIITYAWNDEHSKYTHKFGFLSTHSEYNVIRKYLQTNYASCLEDFSLYNVRINRHNEVKTSRPCRRCQYFLNIFSPKKVFYSDDDSEFVEMKG